MSLDALYQPQRQSSRPSSTSDPRLAPEIAPPLNSPRPLLVAVLPPRRSRPVNAPYHITKICFQYTLIPNIKQTSLCRLEAIASRLEANTIKQAYSNQFKHLRAMRVQEGLAFLQLHKQTESKTKRRCEHHFSPLRALRQHLRQHVVRLELIAIVFNLILILIEFYIASCF